MLCMYAIEYTTQNKMQNERERGGKKNLEHLAKFIYLLFFFSSVRLFGCVEKCAVESSRHQSQS